MSSRIINSNSPVAALLAHVKLSPMERRAAEADLAKGEALAELFIQIGAAVRAGIHRAERSLRALSGSHSAH